MSNSFQNHKSTIKCVILDDEPRSREIIGSFVKQVDYMEVIAICEDPFDALNILRNNQIDLLITVIQMPKLNGLELVRCLPYEPAVIFVTANDNYAVDSFEMGVVDYLLKPVSFGRLLKAIQRVEWLIRREQENELINKKKVADYIFIKGDNELKKITYKEILYIKSAKDYIRIYITDNNIESYNCNSKFLVTYLSMKSIQEKLPSDQFIRIHNSYVVPINSIKAVTKKSVILTNGESLPVSQSHKDHLLAVLNQ
jgi:two-component system LytT family response regulator